MGESDEEFEPLFDYKRVQPIDLVCIDDDSDCSSTNSRKRRKVSSKNDVNLAVEVIDCDDRDEEVDFLLLPPTPMILVDMPKADYRDLEDSFIRELRKKQEELASFAKSTEGGLKADDEPLEEDVGVSLQSSPEPVEKPTDKKPSQRAKIVVSIQAKEGQQKFRIFVDDKFERLFKMYSEKVKIDLRLLVFCFDGEKVSPSSSPASLEMDDEDIIEVHVKSR